MARPFPTTLLAVILSGCGNCWVADRDGHAGVLPVALVSHATIVGELTIPSYVTAERVDVVIDWAALTSDMDCLPLDPVDDIVGVGLTRFPKLSETEVASALSVTVVEAQDP